MQNIVAEWEYSSFDSDSEHQTSDTDDNVEVVTGSTADSNLPVDEVRLPENYF